MRRRAGLLQAACRGSGRRRRWQGNDRRSANLAALALLLCLAVSIETIVRAGLIHSFLLPPPSAVLASLPSLVMEEDLARRLAMTAGETLAGAGTAMLAGLLLGWALHHWQLARNAFMGWVVATAAAPLILLYPLFLIFFGRGAGTIVTMSAVAAVAPIILKTCEGLDGARRVLLDVGRSFGLSPRQLFWRVRVPAALPAIFSGFRLGLAYALIGVISTEYLTNYGGLGELVTDFADRYEVAAMYGAILFVMVVSAGFLAAVRGLERWLRPH